MLAWFLTSIWHALAGAALLSVFFVGAVYVLCRALADSTAHDQAICGCVDCRRRREAALERWRATQETKRKGKEEWISTRDLIKRGAGTKVSVKGVTYEFVRTEPRNDSWALHLTNVSTGAKTIIIIQYETGHRRYWLLGNGPS